MIAARVARTYRAYRTVTREQAFARGFDMRYLNIANDPGRSADYDYRTARELLAKYPNAIAVDFCMRLHNTRRSRYVPPPGYVIYVKATGGKWGKSSRIVTGEGVTA